MFSRKYNFTQFVFRSQVDTIEQEKKVISVVDILLF